MLEQTSIIFKNKFQLAGFLTIAFLAIFFIGAKCSLAAGEVVINEIFSDPPGTDTGLEWIELYNPGSQAAELTGWQLSTASSKYFTFPAFTLEPNSFVVIHWRTDGQDTPNELFTGISITENMGNESGYVAIFKSEQRNKDTIIDYVEYGKAGKTWESTAVGAGIWSTDQFIIAPEADKGQSLGLKQDGQDTNLVTDWQIFSQPTPGQSNTSSPPPLPPPPQTEPPPSQNTPPQNAEGQTEQPPSSEVPVQPQAATSSLPTFLNISWQIFINEFLPAPETGQKEWVELISRDATTIDLSGWQIDDQPEASSPQKIPGGTLIQPGQLLVIQLNKNMLNNDGDQVRLLWPNGQLIHSVSYQKAIVGQSLIRDDNGQWVWTSQPTPGQKNVLVAESTQPQKSTSQPSPSEPTPPPSTATEKTVSLPPPPINPVAEEVTTQKSPQTDSSQKQTKAASQQATAGPLPAVTQPSSPDLKPAAIGEINQIKAQVKNSTNKTFLVLGGVIALSFLSGLGLVWLRRKKVVDTYQKNDTI